MRYVNNTLTLDVDWHAGTVLPRRFATRSQWISYRQQSIYDNQDLRLLLDSYRASEEILATDFGESFSEKEEIPENKITENNVAPKAAPFRCRWLLWTLPSPKPDGFCGEEICDHLLQDVERSNGRRPPSSGISSRMESLRLHTLIMLPCPQCGRSRQTHGRGTCLWHSLGSVMLTPNTSQTYCL